MKVKEIDHYAKFDGLISIFDMLSTHNKYTSIQVFMAPVVARIQYALPALARQLSADDLQRVDAVFNKARRWQLTSIVQNSVRARWRVRET